MPKKKRKSDDGRNEDDNVPQDKSFSSCSTSSTTTRKHKSLEGTKRTSSSTNPAIDRDGDELDHDIGEEEEEDVQFMFSQQAPEQSQPLQPAKANERANLRRMNATTKDKAVTNLSRLLLFKALSGEPIDRLKCVKEALADIRTSTSSTASSSSSKTASAAAAATEPRVTSALLNEAEERLRAVFGFELRPIPAFMERYTHLPTKYKDRLYVINDIQDDEVGTHSRLLHSIHVDASIERGLLMLILAFAYCRGKPRSDGSRWISAEDLYGLLHGLDENIPGEPPAPIAAGGGSGRRRGTTGGGTTGTPSPSIRRFSRRKRGDEDGHDGDGLSHTPDVDTLLERFVHTDYLLKEKVDPNAKGGGVVPPAEGESGISYAMGPRAAMEIGRKQIIHFCAEILDEQPDPTMLAEIENGNGEEEEGGNGGGGREGVIIEQG